MPPDPTPPPTSDPNKPGSKTSEFSALVVGVGIMSAVLSGAGVALGQLKDVMPGAGWIAVALTVVTSLGGVAAMVSKYIGGRSDVKVEQLGVQQAQLQVQAAQAVAQTKLTSSTPNAAAPPHP